MVYNDEFYFAQRNGTDKLLVPSDYVNPIKRELQFIAKLIGSHECRGVDRDIFHLKHHQYDHHNNLHSNLNDKFNELNDAIEAFVIEMKHQNIWEDITVVVTSDFGRTLTQNSGGGTGKNDLTFIHITKDCIDSFVSNYSSPQLSRSWLVWKQFYIGGEYSRWQDYG